MYKYDGLVMTLGIFIMIFSLVGAAAGARPLLENGGGGPQMEWVADSFSESISGSTSENSESEETITVAYERVVSIKATLSWTDEDPSGAGSNLQTNEPDNFAVSIKSPSGAIDDKSEESDSGSVSVTITVPEDSQEEPGDWVIAVHGGDCGDIYGFRGVRLISQDQGNDWSLDIEVNYEEYREVEEEGSPAEEALMVVSPAYRIYRFLDPRI